MSPVRAADPIDLQHTAARHRLAARSPLIGAYLHWWLREVVGPFAAPKTIETYTAIVARYIAPYLGEKRLDALTVNDNSGIRETCPK